MEQTYWGKAARRTSPSLRGLLAGSGRTSLRLEWREEMGLAPCAARWGGDGKGVLDLGDGVPPRPYFDLLSGSCTGYFLMRSRRYYFALPLNRTRQAKTN
jgi:hypothetical protein